MKKITTILLSLLLVFSLCVFSACDNKNVDNKHDHSDSDVASEETESEEPESAEEQMDKINEETKKNDPNKDIPTGTITPPSHKHSYEKKTVKATCTKEGYTSYKCKCGDTYKEDIVEAAGHTFGAWKVVEKATTKAEGKEERKCTKCGEKETRAIPKEVEGHTHKYTSSVTKKATCTSEGTKTYKCSCGAIYEESISPTGHQYSKSKTVKPTCTKKGYTVYTCSKCGDTYNDDFVKEAGHSYVSKVTKPTCTSSGYTTHKCSECGHSYTDGKTNMTSHKYVSSVTKPTCTEKGYTTHKCSECGTSYKDAYTNALGHSYTSNVVKPTCTEAGYTVHKCSSCGHSYSDNKVDATGHKNTKTEKKAATCGVDGYEKVVCADCGKEISSKTLPKTNNHKFETVNASVAKQRAYESYLHQALAATQGYELLGTDWAVDMCTECTMVKEETLRPAYSEREVAQRMMDLVNEFRWEEFKKEMPRLTKQAFLELYALILDDELIEKANIRAAEIHSDFSHSGSTTNAENIAAGCWNIQDFFNVWKSSTKGHREIMLDKDLYFFGFAMKANESGPLHICGVQSFNLG